MGPKGPECEVTGYAQTSGGGTVPGTVERCAYDGLGSVIGEVDEDGDLKSAGLNDVYGFARASWKATGETVSRHQFVGGLGHVSEEETDLVYMRARYMDPALGRFVSEDPARDGANWFVYAGSDPVNQFDHNGRIALPAIYGIAAGVTFGMTSAVGMYIGMVDGYNQSLDDYGFQTRISDSQRT